MLATAEIVVGSKTTTLPLSSMITHRDADGQSRPLASASCTPVVTGGLCGLSGLNVTAWPVSSSTVHCVAVGQAMPSNRAAAPSETGVVRFGARGS